MPRADQYTADQYIDDKAAAGLLGLSRSYLRQLRVYGGGPAFCHLGARAVRYLVRDLHNWMQSRKVASTSEAVCLAH
jgi:predicted DNA-binding transcriptional regulator AlpA